MLSVYAEGPVAEPCPWRARPKIPGSMGSRWRLLRGIEERWSNHAFGNHPRYFEALHRAFGGSAGLPPNYFVFQARLQRAKQHPLSDQINGMPVDIVLNEAAAAPTFSAIQGPENDPPLARSPSDPFGSLRRGLGILADVVRLVHPLEVASLNALIFGTAAAHFVFGAAVAFAACSEPTPAEPLTCAAGIGAATELFAGGAVLVGVGVQFFKGATVPAFKEWGLP